MRRHHRTTPRHSRTGRLARVLGALLLVAAAGAVTAGAAPGKASGTAAATPLDQVIPAPAAVRPGGSPYRITAATRIRVDGGEEARRVGAYLADILRPSTGYPLPLVTSGPAGIRLKLAEGPYGTEGYRLDSRPAGVTITAAAPAGLFHGVQTLRQLLPPAVEKRTPQPGPWLVAGGTVEDRPRYAYRGAMLDVARHFLTVEQVKRYIDEIALYKFNTLRLHLSDDQGWRIAIDSWPRLATYGGSTQVGGGPGGYYTKDDYREIVRYAASRYLEVVPEIDTPGHTNAALASYAELNCDGVAPPLYTGTSVGFSSLCVDKDITYTFLDDVIREVAALTPGRYLHIGGDEAHSTSHEDYVTFMDRAQPIVATYGKTVIGWHQLTATTPAEGALVQYWGTDSTSDSEKEQVARAARNGTGVILSPADRIYVDMKYTPDTPLGKSWAGYVEVQRSYDWDPGSYLPGVPASAVKGVEAALWTETLSTSDELDYMAFPRLPGAAELGWSPAATHDWDTYKVRLAAQAPRWDALGIGYYRSPQVPWPSA
ncbi:MULTISPECIES: beta-N-acetylhexosaminidase [Streptomyces]|uniref:beta-N-acetylhexosaminidase n=2 Tax=Streptomyces thermoviolaceus TaxID=1952 RepID=Q9RHV6_STRTL|nr:family 20 glycosylhydrolase [Streptomyces thermoviolaceus]MCM3265712.1 beta-N-acetylhexosaminidase [Streptomyces thermoviolaceus]NJP17247.1 family 20 glycosylhydrolase [Streptomyces thermoviolaceus subsp. thermoviolaceus]BAA88762.2 Beta-N-Acetylglucosaminidase [Streptomyces thermoviolaceus]GHB09390.1 beta-N-acetylhexosaminidase [Streptomyces thermoviolaceus subsp. thermoviolaceus]